jgi:hypothetical protein
MFVASFATAFIKRHVTQKANPQNGSHHDHRLGFGSGAFFGACGKLASHLFILYINN